METGLTYTLQRVHWQFFGTLTFKSARLPERVRLSMFFALVRCLCLKRQALEGSFIRACLCSHGAKASHQKPKYKNR